MFTNVVMRELDSQSQTHGGEFADMIRSQLRMQDTENSLLVPSPVIAPPILTCCIAAFARRSGAGWASSRRWR